MERILTRDSLITGLGSKSTISYKYARPILLKLQVIMYEFLTNNQDIATAVATVASVIVAIFAFVASLISIGVSTISLRYQRKHNILSVCPIPEITVADYEHSLRVKIRNNGSGPLIIKKFSVDKGSESKPSIIEWMKSLPSNRPWTHFAKDLENRAILPGQFIHLIELTEYEDEKKFSECRDLCRSWLRDLSCNVIYTDVYGTPFSPYTKNMSWFGRNI